MRSFLISILMLSVGLFFVYNIVEDREEGPITFLDYSYKLDNRVVDTIKVRYVEWACACANWEVLNSRNFNNEEECVFIESEDSKIPEKYLGGNSQITLIGSFYKNKGISRDYEKPTSQKPNSAIVFKYTSYHVN